MHDHGVPWELSADPLYVLQVQYSGENGHDSDDFSNLCRDFLRRLSYFDFATLASVPLELEDGNQRRRVGSRLCSTCTVVGEDCTALSVANLRHSGGPVFFFFFDSK